MEITVYFAPLEAIEYIDNLNIHNNDELVVVNLHGEGIPFNWTEHIIAGFGGAHSVYAINLDGDSDVDVLGAGGDDISWFENNGSQNFIAHSITYGYYDDARCVYAVDLDSDGDIDILGASHNDFLVDAIAWWENNGSQNFSQQHTIDGDFDGAESVYAIDLDRDGDMDVLGAAEYADAITWWENDGSQNFTEHTIADFWGAQSVYAIDLDGDSDVDVLGAASYADAIKWWENDGSQNFTEHHIAGGLDAACSVYAIDIDGDSDVDVLGAARLANDIYWFENDGSQNFTGHTIADNFYGACDAFAIDLDSDGDMDILGGGANAVDDIAWWENDGNQNFTERTITETFDGAYSVYSIDLDNDGDMDVLGAAYFSGRISWWESDLIVVQEPVIALSSDSLLFPETIVGSAAELPLTIYNIGTADLSVESMIFGQYPEVFSVNWIPGDDIIAPGDSLLITAYFEPLTVMNYNDMLSIYNNDELVSIYLEGAGGNLPVVEDVTIAIDGDNVVLTWTPLTSVISYNIYRSSVPYFDITGMTPAGSTEMNEYEDTDALTDGPYFYMVTASNDPIITAISIPEAISKNSKLVD